MTESINIKRITRIISTQGYYQQLYANKTYNLDEIDNFLERHKTTKVQSVRNHLNSLYLFPQINLQAR